MRQRQPGGLYKPCLRDPRAQSSRVPTADSTALGLRPLLQRTSLSRPRWMTGRMGQTGQTPGWPPVSFWCHLKLLTDCLCSLGLLSLPNWPTVSASQATVSAIAATVSAYGLSLQSRQTLSALWNCILAGSYPSIRAALSLYLSAFPYLSKGRKLTKNISQVSVSWHMHQKGCAVHICYIVKKYISLFFFLRR
jgi:hypothetical protein